MNLCVGGPTPVPPSLLVPAGPSGLDPPSPPPVSSPRPWEGKVLASTLGPDPLEHNSAPNSPVRFTPPPSPPESLGRRIQSSPRTKSGSSFSTPGRPEIQSSYPPALVSLPITLPWSGPVSACTWISDVLVVALEAQSRAPGDLQGRQRRSAQGRARSIGEQAGSVSLRPGSSAAEQESRSSGAGEASLRAPPMGGEKGAAARDPRDPEAV